MDSWLSPEPHAVAYLIGKSLEENLYWCLVHSRGMGAHSVEGVLEIATRSFDNLSAILSDKAFFFGGHMSSFGLIAFSQLSSHTLITLNNPMIQACREHTNLIEFTARIQATYFADL